MLRSRQAGASLLEVLVSVVLLSIGVLGATKMQLQALQSNRSSLARVEAVQLANDLVSRIEANSGVDYDPVATGANPASAVDRDINACTPTQLALYDITRWQCSVNSLDTDGNSHTACAALGVTGALPEGRCSLARNADEYAIEVQWTDADSGTAQRVSLWMRAP